MRKNKIIIRKTPASVCVTLQVRVLFFYWPVITHRIISSDPTVNIAIARSVAHSLQNAFDVPDGRIFFTN